jgi:tetratricopeptide (TPR) repeat protein
VEWQSFQKTREANNEGLKLFSKAIELDPNFASPYARAAMLYSIRIGMGWIINRSQEDAEAVRLARRAVDLGRDDAAVLAAAGFVLGYVGGDLNTGAALVDRSLYLNPNDAGAWGCSGWIKLCFGDHETALKHEALAMRMSPLDPRIFSWHTSTAFAYFLMGRYDDAVLSAGRALQFEPNWLGALRITAASNALAGHLDEARQAMMRVRQLDPTLRISNLDSVLMPVQRQQDRLRYIEGLRKAGLPE